MTDEEKYNAMSNDEKERFLLHRKKYEETRILFTNTILKSVLGDTEININRNDAVHYFPQIIKLGSEFTKKYFYGDHE